MPALLPPPIPLFSCSITRTSGYRSRTNATVSSLEPLSTITTSRPRTESRHCSTHGSAFHVTTTTETSGCAIDDGGSPQALPEDDRDARQRQQDRHHEEDEAARERLVGRHAQLAEEADEERLAHADAVDRERHEHDEEEQRPEHDVRQHREVDPDGATRRVDREDTRELRGGRDECDDEEGREVVAVAVQPVVDGAGR